MTGGTTAIHVMVYPDRYKEVVARAIRRIERSKVHFLVLAFGLDTAKRDPTGSWSMSPRDFKECGRLVGSLRRPTVVVQEGGYRIRSLGINARNFFVGLLEGAEPAPLPRATLRLKEGTIQPPSSRRGVQEGGSEMDPHQG